MTAGDEKVRDSHEAEDGHIVALGEEFPVTHLEYPCDDSGDDPGEVINCRCVAIAVLNKDEEE